MGCHELLILIWQRPRPRIWKFIMEYFFNQFALDKDIPFIFIDQKMTTTELEKVFLQTGRYTIPLVLRYGTCLVGGLEDTEWYPRSPDLTDSFLWGALRDNVYYHRPTIHLQLTKVIEDEIGDFTKKRKGKQLLTLASWQLSQMLRKSWGSVQTIFQKEFWTIQRYS